MKKKVLILIVIVIIIIATIFVKNKMQNSKYEYNISEVEIYEYAKFKENEKFGIMDRAGNIIIGAAYNKIQIPNPEKDIFICYNEADKTVVLNAKNEPILTKYNKVEPIKIKNIASTLCYEKSVLKYEKDGKYGLIDFEGRELANAIYDSIENLQSTEGKILVNQNNKYGVININGLTLVGTKYDKVVTDGYYTEENGYIESGFIVSNTTNDGYRYGYIDYKGKEILKPEYSDILRISNKKDLYLLVAKNGQYGLYKEDKQLIKHEYQSIGYTDNGAVIIEKNEQFGIANLEGQIKVEPKYSKIEEDGIYIYAQNAQENDVYDIDGNKIDMNFNKSIYNTANENYKITTIINNGITYCGIEDKEGKTLVKADYKYIEYMYGDYFIAQNEKDKYGVINSTGKTQIKFKYDLIQRIKEKDIIQVSLANSTDISVYSSELKEVVSIKNGKIQNKINFVKVYNEKENIYLDKAGNKIEENSEIVQKELQSELPKEINDYKLVQISLEDAYYEKK